MSFPHTKSSALGDLLIPLSQGHIVTGESQNMKGYEGISFLTWHVHQNLPDQKALNEGEPITPKLWVM